MVAKELRVDAVKTALASGSASPATVSALQILLTSKPAPMSSATASKSKVPGTSKSTTSRGSKTRGRTLATQQPVEVHEDAPETISPKAKYALATEVVNVTLKALTAAAKSQQKIGEADRLHDAAKHTASRLAQTPQGEPAGPPGPLQPRCGNSTPVPSKADDRTRPLGGPNATGHGSHILATAECARFAFSYLRSTDAQKVRLKTQPQWQLETGMLALASRLVSLGLETLAVKELRVLKRRLQASALVSEHDGEPVKATKVPGSDNLDRETLASLLSFGTTFEDASDALTLAISHQLLVLKVIASSRKLALIESSLGHLSLAQPGSPGSLLKLQATATGHTAKAAKQLESLAQTILSLCPSASSIHDDVAVNPLQSPSPKAVFELQVLALQLRREWWTLVGHQADEEKELAEPFLRCLAAFSRRAGSIARTDRAYDLIERSHELLSLQSVVCRPDVRFDICKAFTRLAEAAGTPEKALLWTERMESACSSLEPQHVRKTTCLVKRLALTLPTPLTQERRLQTEGAIQTIAEVLQTQLSGHSADYEMLLYELARLLQISNDNTALTRDLVNWSPVIFSAAGFAQRYARSYPSLNTLLVQQLLHAAIRQSKTSEEMQKWTTQDAARVYIRCGTLHAVADAAACMPVAEAWLTSGDAVALDKVLQALLTRHLKRDPGDASVAIFDDDALSPDERGTLLDRQLCYALEITGQSKYQAALQKLMPDLLRRLSKLYTPAEYPIRRTRIACFALRLRESHPELLPPHAVKVWLDESNPTDVCLAKDEGLKRYLPNITAGLTVARAFYEGRPTAASLRPSLLAWQQIFDIPEAMCERIYDIDSLSTQLKAIATYLGMLGNDNARLSVLQLLLRLRRRFSSSANFECLSATELARQYTEMCYAEKAGNLLAEARKIAQDDSVTALSKLQLSVAYAEYYVAIEDFESARTELDRANELRSAVQPESVARRDRGAYELLHAQAWLVQSKLCLGTGMATDALATAKRAVRLLNATWTAIERATAKRESESVVALPETAEPDINALISGVSKLQLIPKEPPNSKASIAGNDRGARLWAVVPLSCHAMMHLSEMYAHHGLYAEADYYSDRAINVAETVQSTVLLARVRSHRSLLMTLAGRLEDAELCLTRSEEDGVDEQSIAKLEYYGAKAMLRTKEGSLEEALQLYKQAVTLVDKLREGADVKVLERFSAKDVGETERTQSLVVRSADPALGTTTNGDAAAPANRSLKGRRHPPISNPSKGKAAPKRSVTASRKTERTPASQCYLLDKMQAGLALEHDMVCLRAGRDVAKAPLLPSQRNASTLYASRQRHVEFHALMRQVALALQADVSYNALPESTLSFPALRYADRCPSELGPDDLSSLSLQHSSSDKLVVSARSGSRKRPDDNQVPTLLLQARDCLVSRYASSERLRTTADLHLECAMLLRVTLLLSATGMAQAQHLLHPVREALRIELPKIMGVRCEAGAISVDNKQIDALSQFTWPALEQTPPPSAMSAAHFQQQYVDILPTTWTTVSICLNDDGSELYVARYREGQSPLILRLPFSRHKPEASDEEAFDYHMAKAELQDIVQASNYSCHKSGNVEGKGAKNNWWAEREALDRRLHELIVNVESIWFGGFKSVFSLQVRYPDLLARFSKSFDGILARHLPSRQSVKDRGKLYALDDKALELFIGLGSDQDGIIDLDEPIADLLYFVVDMLQFNGERNAYDEIDFDSMAVDVLDTLRSYHEACPEPGDDARHLILILDKRLQAFPWEGLPCLERTSVSRLNSMLSLRARILAMRRQQKALAATGSSEASPDDYHTVSRMSGTYILNPSKDLTSTQTTLSQPLSALTKADGAQWNSLVQQEPDEDDFRRTLTDSSMLLYFGHGAGSQYIRPRTIRKLDMCSEVVWLMGCSSGAVTEYGELEPFAVPFAYLMAGSRESEEESGAMSNSKCMAVVATLWDVTDKDIDRFSLAMGEEWGLWPPSEASKLPAKIPRKRERLVAPSTPRQATKTPKTPRARKTPAPPAKTPDRSRTWSQPQRTTERKRSLVEAVARSREACYLRYLNGAAPVVYGVPVYLGD